MKKMLCLILAALLTLTACGQVGSTVAAEESVERNGDIVILYTGDVHCGVDQGFGYAGLQQVREYLLSEGNEVILVDEGDSIRGEPIGTVT